MFVSTNQAKKKEKQLRTLNRAGAFPVCTRKKRVICCESLGFGRSRGLKGGFVSSQWRFWLRGPVCGERCSSYTRCGRPAGNSLDPPLQRTAGARIPEEQILQSVQQNTLTWTQNLRGISSSCTILSLSKKLLTHLTDVTVNMEAAVQSHYPDRLLLTLLGHDGLTANRTTRCIFPVREETSVRIT